MSYDNMDELVGHTITEVWWSDDYITFVLEDSKASAMTWVTSGDCCSITYLTDFIGLDKLVDAPVISTRAIDLDHAEMAQVQARSGKHENDYGELEFYGYEIVVDNPLWGEMTVVISFRNASNGYYGGSLSGPLDSNNHPYPGQERLTADVVSG